MLILTARPLLAAAYSVPTAAMKKHPMKQPDVRPPNAKSSTHGFTVMQNPYESKWEHIPVKETTQRLININKMHRKKSKQKLCFTTSTRQIPVKAFQKPVSRPSSAPAGGQADQVHPRHTKPVPPTSAKPSSLYSTRKIKSAVRRVEEEERPVSPVEVRRSPTAVEVKVRMDDIETKEKLAAAEADKIVPPCRELNLEIEQLKRTITQLEETLQEREKSHREKQHQLQVEFNKNLSSTLSEKKKELKRLKELHYQEVSTLKLKMNDALKMQRCESAYLIAKLKGEIDSNRQHYSDTMSSQEKLKIQHGEALQDLQNDLILQHQTEKTKLVRDLEERMTREKEGALEGLRSKVAADVLLLKQQHQHELDEILSTFEGISLEEVDSNRATIQEQEVQLNCYKRAQRKLEEELRVLMNELSCHKTALKQLQDSFFDKVHEVDKKYTAQLSSLLVDNKDLRKRYLTKCDELFTLKSSYNRLQEAKGYIAKEMLSALMQGKQPHVITSSAVKASWSTDGMDGLTKERPAPRTPSSYSPSPAKSAAVPLRGSERAPSACSIEDPAALMLSTCSYIQDNSSCSRNPRPLSETLFSKDDFLHPLSVTTSETNLSESSPRIARVRSVTSALQEEPPVRKERPVSSVCVVRPHSRQQEAPCPAVQRATSADPRTRGVVESVHDITKEFFNLPMLSASTSPMVQRRSQSEDYGAGGHKPPEEGDPPFDFEDL